MTDSTKPYLIRAIHEWCVDQGFTPYLAAVVNEHTRVPPGYARDGQIVLNLSSDATHQLNMANDIISFQARFGGVAQGLAIPVANVVAIYARENGQGMAFEPDDTSMTLAEGRDDPSAGEDVPAPSIVPPTGLPEPAPLAERAKPPSGKPTGGGRGSHLKIIK